MILKIVALLALFLGFGSSKAAAQHMVLLDSTMMMRLGQVAETATTEHARCLLGIYKGDTVAADVAWPPKILYTDSLNVFYAKCPLASVGTWHNHIQRAKHPAQDWCYLSPADSIGLKLGRERLIIVSVNEAIMCAWVRDVHGIHDVTW